MPVSRTHSRARVGVARVERGTREVVAIAGDEATQPQDALKRLGTVADGRQEAASQLALAEPEIGSQRFDPLSRVREAHDRRLNCVVRWAIIDEPRRRRMELTEHDAGVGLAVQLFPRVEPQRGDRDPLVAKLRQGNPKGGPAGTGKEARAEDQLTGLGARQPRPRVWPGDDGALALAPDDVRAAVREHSDGAGAASDP